MSFWEKQPTRLSIILYFRFILKYCIKNYFLECKIPKRRLKQDTAVPGAPERAQGNIKIDEMTTETENYNE